MTLSEDKIYEIQQDEINEKLIEDWIDLNLFMDKTMVDFIPTDLFYNDQEHTRHILKFLQFLKTDSFVNYEKQRYGWFGN